MPDTEAANEASGTKGRPWLRALAIAIPLAIAVGAASWLLMHPNAQEPVSTVARTNDPVPILSALIPTAAPEAPSRAAVPPPRGSEGDRPEQMQVCGGEWVTTHPDGSSVATQTESPQQRAARDRIVALLQRDPDPYARAVGIWLDGARSIRDGAPDREHWNAVVRRLADEAAHSEDARIYSLALGACRSMRDDPSCAQLSFDQWARLDPENGYPWMFVVDDAAGRRDDAARDEGLHRLSTATRVDSGFYEAPRVIATHAPGDDASLVAAFALISQAIGTEAAQELPYQTVMHACRMRIEQDPNRWQTCSAAASALAERSDNLLSRAVGRAIGRRLGWPIDRQDRLGGEAARWSRQQETLTTAPFDEARTGSCEGIRRWLQLVARSDREGEVGALKAALAASAASDDELLRLGRAERERREATIARAGDVAAAASAVLDASSAAPSSSVAAAASSVEVSSIAPASTTVPR